MSDCGIQVEIVLKVGEVYREHYMRVFWDYGRLGSHCR